MAPDQTASTATAEWSGDAAAEAAHLRLILDKQPSCMARVGIDGTLLAVNDASLSLLQVDALGELLGSSLLDRIDVDHRSAWLAFAARVWERGGASLESVFAGPSRETRHVQMQGIAMQHPDHVPSILLALRDTSMSHQLEQSLV